MTGASKGIGYELAKQFAENGYDLVITAKIQVAAMHILPDPALAVMHRRLSEPDER